MVMLVFRKANKKSQKWFCSVLYFSGIPETVPASSVNRQCGSGLQAFMNIAGYMLF